VIGLGQPGSGEDQIDAGLVNRRRRERNRLFRELIEHGSIVSAHRHAGSVIESAAGLAALGTRMLPLSSAPEERRND